MRMKREAARAVAASLMVAASAGACAADATPTGAAIPAEAFFGTSEMYGPRLSPQGDALAVLIRGGDNRRVLAVLDLKDLKKVKVVAAYSDADVVSAHWADNARLVYWVGDEAESLYHQGGSGLYAVDRDGTDQRNLIIRHGVIFQTGTNLHQHMLLPRDYAFSQTLDDGKGEVIVNHYLYDSSASPGYYVFATGVVPMRLDTRTGALREAVSGPIPDHARRWYFDDKGVARMVVTVNGGTEALLSPDKSGAWIERAHFPSFGTSPHSFHVVEAGPDGVVYAVKNASDEYSSRSLFRLDPATGLPEKEPLVHVAGFDVDRGSMALVGDLGRHRLLGLHFESDAASTVWFDPDMKALQAKVDAKLPGLVNRIDVASCGCSRMMLVTSSSDRQPEAYFLYDRDSEALVSIGTRHPAIKARAMGTTDFFRIKARDGHDLPVYVTKPKEGKGPFPTVVLVHGGPWLRGFHWGWNAEAQFLASRGYLVVQPEFRGSRGYGDDLFLAGLKQWGLKMQDDIADATVWAAKQGLADASRTCIAGASYGGYATLMGLVRYGELYRCGVAWAAVSDIDLMYTNTWSDTSDDIRRFDMPAMIGDPVRDAAQLAQTSPLKQVASIKRPLLLAHGGIDRRVPLEHATKLRDALEAQKAPVSWIQYPEEGHGWMRPETRIGFYQRMEAFLAANIGPGAEVTKAAAN